MNRFKVKAKLAEGDRWVEGYYVFTNNKHHIITEQGGLSYPEQIHPDTICRCLDRFDIHGELIYENDHIRSGEVVGNHLDKSAKTFADGGLAKPISEYILYQLDDIGTKWYFYLKTSSPNAIQTTRKINKAKVFNDLSSAHHYNYHVLGENFIVQELSSTFAITVKDGKTHSNV